MKKILAAFIILVLITAGVLILFENIYGKKITNEKISDRSKSFITAQKRTSLLQDPTKNSDPSHIEKSNCFSFTIPWSIALEREDGECNWHYLTNNPKVNINIFTNTVSYSLLEDEPGIRFRRDRHDEYSESNIKTDERTYVVFHKTKGPYEVNAFFLNKNRLFVINILSYSSENLDDQLKEILSSIKLAS